jgi:hypothetical protein
MNGLPEDLNALMEGFVQCDCTRNTDGLGADCWIQCFAKRIEAAYNGKHVPCSVGTCMDHQLYVLQAVFLLTINIPGHHVVKHEVQQILSSINSKECRDARKKHTQNLARAIHGTTTTCVQCEGLFQNVNTPDGCESWNMQPVDTEYIHGPDGTVVSTKFARYADVANLLTYIRSQFTSYTMVRCCQCQGQGQRWTGGKHGSAESDDGPLL